MMCQWCHNSKTSPCSYCRSTPEQDRAALAAINARFHAEVEAVRMARAMAGNDGLPEGDLGKKLARLLLATYTEQDLKTLDYNANEGLIERGQTPLGRDDLEGLPTEPSA